MADETKVAKRYAAAIFGVAQKENALDAVNNDFLYIEDRFQVVEDLRKFIITPIVPVERKNEVVKEAFGKNVSDTTLNLLYLLIRKRRETIIDDVIKQFHIMLDLHLGRVVAHVSSAVKLNQKQLTALQTALEARTGKTVSLQSLIEPELIGGVRVRIGDNVIDSSVKGRLDRVRSVLIGVQ
jgi:F-type H+-transporting ATPase subunit delta